MYVCVCTCVYVCVCVHVCDELQACVTYVYENVDCAYVDVAGVCLFVYVFVHVWMCVCACVCMSVCACDYMRRAASSRHVRV